jgi:hypothetical protein
VIVGDSAADDGLRVRHLVCILSRTLRQVNEATRSDFNASRHDSHSRRDLACERDRGARISGCESEEETP